jgi:NYN domain
MSTHRRTQILASPATGTAAAILDLENLLYPERRISGDAVRAGFTSILNRISALADVHHAVGCCDRWLAGVLAPVAASSHVRIYPCALGKDVADTALLRRAIDVPARVETLIVGSGDAAFAPLVAAQGLAGRRTIVLGRAGGIARTLRCAADEVVELEARSLQLVAA